MALNDHQGEYITGGTFLYDGLVPKRVTIIAKDHDASYALGKAEDWLEAGETAMPVGPDGVLYYQLGELTPHQTLAQVKAWIDGKAYGPIEWDDSVRKPGDVSDTTSPWGNRR